MKGENWSNYVSLNKKSPPYGETTWTVWVTHKEKPTITKRMNKQKK